MFSAVLIISSFTTLIFFPFLLFTLLVQERMPACRGDIQSHLVCAIFKSFLVQFPHHSVLLLIFKGVYLFHFYFTFPFASFFFLYF
jgi:hypothetical protein